VAKDGAGVAGSGGGTAASSGGGGPDGGGAASPGESLRGGGSGRGEEGGGAAKRGPARSAVFGPSDTRLRKVFMVYDLEHFIALPKCYAAHRNHEVLSKSLVPNVKNNMKFRKG
jgi:hypothetical protein